MQVRIWTLIYRENTKILSTDSPWSFSCLGIKDSNVSISYKFSKLLVECSKIILVNFDVFSWFW
jgi:hypothetical protein